MRIISIKGTCKHNKIFIALGKITRRKIYDREKFFFSRLQNWRLISSKESVLRTSANIFLSAYFPNWLCAIRESILPDSSAFAFASLFRRRTKRRGARDKGIHFAEVICFKPAISSHNTRSELWITMRWFFARKVRLLTDANVTQTSPRKKNGWNMENRQK